MTTDADGRYSFPDLSAGTYIVVPERTGYEFTERTLSVTLFDQDAVDRDFTAQLIPPTHSISGQVTESGAGLSGVTVTLSGAGSAIKITGADGIYSFTELQDGTYTITPTLNGYTFSPPNLDTTLQGSDIGNQDFTGTQNAPP